MTNDLLVLLIGAGGVGGVSSAIVTVVRARSENQKQGAETMAIVSDVYGETIATLRADILDLRQRIDTLETERAAVVARNRMLTALLVEHKIPVPAEASEG